MQHEETSSLELIPSSLQSIPYDTTFYPLSPSTSHTSIYDSGSPYDIHDTLDLLSPTNSLGSAGPQEWLVLPSYAAASTSSSSLYEDSEGSVPSEQADGVGCLRNSSGDVSSGLGLELQHECGAFTDSQVRACDMDGYPMCVPDVHPASGSLPTSPIAPPARRFACLTPRRISCMHRCLG